MKNKYVLLVSSCVLLASCESMMPGPPQVMLPPLDNVVPCPTGGTNNITIIANTSQFSVAPPHLCIHVEEDQDTEIYVNFAGNHDPNVIHIAAKAFINAPWLSASNPGTTPDKATITVPAGTAAGTYYYTVTAIGWGTIDPMITVDN